MSYERDEIDLRDPLLREGPAVGAHTGMLPFSSIQGISNTTAIFRRHSTLRTRDDSQSSESRRLREIPQTELSVPYCQVRLHQPGKAIEYGELIQKVPGDLSILSVKIVPWPFVTIGQ